MEHSKEKRSYKSPGGRREARLVVLEIRGFSCKLDKDSSLHSTSPPLNKDVSGQKTIIYRFPRRL